MKKLLTILGAVGLTATTGATVVACGNQPDKGEKVKLDMVTSKITIVGSADSFQRPIENFDKIKNLKVELKDIPKDLVKVEIKDKALFVDAKEIKFSVDGQIILTADNIDQVAIDLSLIKDYQGLLNGKTFEVTLNSFTGGELPADDKGGNQNQWGENSIGALYASLWSINFKKQGGVNPSYPHLNKNVAEVLTNGESVNRGDDSGLNIKIGDRLVTEVAKEKGLDDWHKVILEKDDVVKFDVEIISYAKNDKDELVPTPHEVNFNLKIVE